ncbi:MAG: hypothetical protein MOB07_00425 [Acidobacteria bacterium]|nr:hypothetical protein [Acidobacteriota bacterium]
MTTVPRALRYRAREQADVCIVSMTTVPRAVRYRAREQADVGIVRRLLTRAVLFVSPVTDKRQVGV